MATQMTTPKATELANKVEGNVFTFTGKDAQERATFVAEANGQAGNLVHSFRTRTWTFTFVPQLPESFFDVWA